MDRTAPVPPDSPDTSGTPSVPGASGNSGCRDTSEALVPFEPFTFASADGATVVSGGFWLPPASRPPVATLQIVHGMTEHIGRYDRFARRLALMDCAVAAHDHVGHGKSVSTPESPADSWGYLEPNAGAGHLVEDVHTVRGIVDGHFPGVPHVLFGHSMGSFVSRAYVGRHGSGLDAAIFCGTGWQPRVALAFGGAVTSAMGRLFGWSHVSPLVESLVIGAYARRFASENDPLAWLSRDPDSNEAYRRDDACGFPFTVAGYHELFRLIAIAQDRSLVSAMPHDLPVLLISGADDPVGNMGRGAPKVAELLRSCGVADVELRLYQGARHELLNETNRDEVFADIVSWLSQKGVFHA